jgi:hypothetical protein
MKRKPFNSDLSSETSDFEDAKPGAGSAGQSGDTQGLSDDEDADSESVRELVEEGQAYEASVISAIENAPPADVAEVRTREVPEDDVPDEYIVTEPEEQQ